MRVISALCLIFAQSAFAINIPTASYNTSQDRIRTPDGFQCETSIGSSTTIQMGVSATAGVDDSNYWDSYSHGSNRDESEVGAFFQVVIPVGAPERIDCSRLYDLELRAREMEIRQLEKQIELMSVDKSQIFVEK